LDLHARQVQRDPRLGRRFDASGVVQEALLCRHSNLGQFRGSTEGQVAGWLQKSLANVVADEIDNSEELNRRWPPPARIRFSTWSDRLLPPNTKAAARR
jgi:DNA-directed RNA polymerase specialized sigma24 family protein